jgi:hypothetical protein
MNIENFDFDLEEIFEGILRTIEENNGRKIRRIARQAQDEINFYMTIIFTDYKLLEVTITKESKFDPYGGILSFEIEEDLY